MTSHRTIGGALVRVAPEGVKVDFPSGVELLVDRRCRVHVRGAGATLPALHGIDLVLADGTRVVSKPSGSAGREPLRTVGVEDANTKRMLWQSRRRVRTAAHRRDPSLPSSGLTYHVLGDGDVLYRCTERGPLVLCERIFCPAERRREFPERRYVVVGDALSESLTELPRRLPKKSTEYPDGPKAGQLLAKLAPRLFVRGAQRPPEGAVVGTVVPMFGDMRLELEERPKSVVMLKLTAPSAALPVAEWICGQSAMLQLVRQDANEPGRPRYFQRGVRVEYSPRRVR